MKTAAISCLLACQGLSLFQSTVALPLSQRDVLSKGLLLWEWTLSQAAEGGDENIKSSALEAAASASLQATINWDVWRPKELPTDMAFYPMIRTPSQLAADPMAQLQSSIEVEQAAARQPTILFYNEPEYQSVSAADAVATWRSTMLPLRAAGAKLVGPAPSSSDVGRAWQGEFMAALADDEKPDLLGIHFYTTQGNAIDSEVAWAQNYFAEEYAKYGIPLQVSEIACTSRDAGEVQSFSDTMESWMDGQDFINSYGFFGVSTEPANDWVSPVAQLMDTAGKFTTLGKSLLGVAKA